MQSVRSWIKVALVVHAYSHLQMDTHLGPIAGSLSFVGFLVAVVATWLDQRRRPPSTIERRRAA